MPEITAVVLAAGLGMRMGPRGRMTPKGLIEMGGRGLVPQSVETLRRWGATRIAIVTGHLADHYQAAFAGTDVQLIHNPAYDHTGSLRTLIRAMEVLEGPLLLLESDLIYAPQVLDAVTVGADQFMVSGPTGAGDEVYTWVDAEARLSLISKDRGARDTPPLGEMIGVTALSAEAVSQMRGVAERVQARSPGAHYEDGLVELAAERAIACPFFPKVAWAEVDNEEMLARATAEVWPQIQAARAARWGDADL